MAESLVPLRRPEDDSIATKHPSFCQALLAIALTLGGIETLRRGCRQPPRDIAQSIGYRQLGEPRQLRLFWPAAIAPSRSSALERLALSPSNGSALAQYFPERCGRLRPRRPQPGRARRYKLWRLPARCVRQLCGRG